MGGGGRTVAFNHTQNIINFYLRKMYIVFRVQMKMHVDEDENRHEDKFEKEE